MGDLVEVTLRRRLGLTAASTLNKQRDDERCLRPDESDRAQDMPAVLPPGRRLSEFERAPAWQAVLTDLPPLQLPPVVPRTRGRKNPRREFGDRFPAQDRNGDASRRGARR